MHFNPCGRAVDWIQFPFEVLARVHRGEGAPIVRLRWTFTNLSFLPLDTQSAVNNRIWNVDQTSDLTVGQLPLVESDYVQDARFVTPPGLTGRHMCHPEWFSTGEPWPNTLPPQIYDARGTPICCGAVVGNVMSETDPGGPTPIIYGAVANVATEQLPVGRVNTANRAAANVAAEGRPVGIVVYRPAPTANVETEAEPVLYLWNTQYSGSCGTDVFNLTGPVSSADLRWTGNGSTTGKQWLFLYYRPTGARGLSRHKNGLPTFYTWDCSAVWDRRGTSPAFLKNPAVQAGSPACAPTLTATGTDVYTH